MEKLIIELFERIKKLEDRVGELEAQYELRNSDSNIKEKGKKEKITRKVSRNFVIQKLQEENKGLHAQKGNKSMQTDILIDMKKKSLKVKYLHSKSYNENFAAGWNTLDVEDIKNKKYDVYIFCIVFNEEFKTFIFSNEDMLNIISNKQIDASGNYHFYIHIKEDGRKLECRDQEIDIEKNYEDWTLISRIIDEL